jgi:hypothetical protein
LQGGRGVASDKEFKELQEFEEFKERSRRGVHSAKNSPTRQKSGERDIAL